MKKNILILILFISVNYAYSQKLDVRILGGVGISTENLKAPTTAHRLSHKNDQSLYSTPLSLEINYYFYKSLFIGTGVSYLKFNYNQIMESAEFGYILESVDFSESYLSIPLNIGFEFAVTDHIKLGLQYSLHYDIPLFKDKTIENHKVKKYGFIDYNYTLNQTLESKINHNLTFYSKVKLSNQINVILELGYNIRENGFYGYESDQTTHSTNQDTGITTFKTITYENSEESLDHNFINFKIGVSKTISFKKKNI